MGRGKGHNWRRQQEDLECFPRYPLHHFWLLSDRNPGTANKLWQGNPSTLLANFRVIIVVWGSSAQATGSIALKERVWFPVIICIALCYLELALLRIQWLSQFRHLLSYSWLSVLQKGSPIKSKKLDLGNCSLPGLLQEHQLSRISPDSEEIFYFRSRSTIRMWNSEETKIESTIETCYGSPWKWRWPPLFRNRNLSSAYLQGLRSCFL